MSQSLTGLGSLPSLALLDSASARMWSNLHSDKALGEWKPTARLEADCVRTRHCPQPHSVPRNHGNRDCVGERPGRWSSRETTGLERINEPQRVHTGTLALRPGKG